MILPPVVVLSKLPEAILEIVRLVVDAVPKYPVPETVNAVDDAYVKLEAVVPVAVK